MILTLILILFGKVDISFGLILDAFFPVLREEYWFFTVYILLYMISPFINKMLSQLSDMQATFLVVMTILFFYVEPIFSVVFIQYDVTEGFSIIGFITLYIIGGYLTRLKKEPKKVTWLCILLINSLIMFASKILLTIITNRLKVDFGAVLFYHNNMIFVLLNAISIFYLFKGTHFSTKLNKVIKWFSGSVFMVYLLHEKTIIGVII